MPQETPGRPTGEARAGGPAASRSLRPSRRQALVALAVLTLVVLVAWRRCGLAGCPSVDTLVAYQPDRAPVLLDREGGELARLRPGDRIPIPLDSIPEPVRAAFVAVEDRRFRSHDGVDWLRVPGALLANLEAGGVSQGFSTITMQLARNVFPERLPGQDRTVRRKLLEIRVAGEIEDRFSKDEILELYLNHIYFGDGVRGIRGGARHWFGTSPERLRLHEGALLAALPRAPEAYHPRRHPERARERRDLVLALMARQGVADSADVARARGLPLGVVPRPPDGRRAARTAGWFVEQARRALEEHLGERLYAVPLRIRTTLDPTTQTALEEEIARQIRWVEAGGYGRFDHPRYDPSAPPGDSTPYLQGAGVVVDAAAGDVLALVGGRDFRQSTFDRAVRARRQVGSAFKPFVYAAAIADGVRPDDTLEDAPLTLEVGGRPWTPRNFDGRHAGEVTVREALVRSLNVPTVRLARRVGTGRVARLAEEAGVAAEVPREPSMALGTVASSPLALAAAYTPFARDGVRVDPRFVLSVESPEGEVVWRPEPRERRVMDADVARTVTDVLTGVVDGGTGGDVRRAGFRGPAAGKTGTTTDAMDVWFVGYTPERVGVVWMGFDRPATIVPRASGGVLAAPVWGRTFARAGRGRPAPDPFRRPPDPGEQRNALQRLLDRLGGVFGGESEAQGGSAEGGESGAEDGSAQGAEGGAEGGEGNGQGADGDARGRGGGA